MFHRFPVGRVSLPVHALGVAILLLGVVHVLLASGGLPPRLGEAAILFAFAGTTFYVGARVDVDWESVHRSLRVVVLSLGAGVVVGGLATAFVTFRASAGIRTAEPAYVLSIGWSIGVATGALVGYYYSSLETTLREQRRLAKRLTILQRVLRHNLRNELMVIGGTASELDELVDDSALRRRLAVIRRHTDRVVELSETSQQLTRIWRTDRTVPTDLGPLLDGELDRFRERYPGVPVDLTTAYEGAVDVHPEFNLAVREALENAAVHNDAVAVSIAVRPASDADGQVDVEVRDTGTGIPTTELTPLWQAGEEPLAHTTGLGLWLIYWLVDRSDGTLDVETGESGTRVRMRLPVA